MTQHADFGQGFTQPPIPEPAPVEVAAGSDDELAQLHAHYADVKARADESAKQLAAIKDRIKVKLNALDPESRRFLLSGENGPALSLTYSVSKRFDSRRFRKDQPQTYDQYLTESGSWALKEA